MIRNSSLAWGGALLGSLMALAACGSSGGTTAGGTASSAAATPTTSASVSTAAADTSQTAVDVPTATATTTAPVLTAAVDPCTLVTPNEAAAVLGADPGPGKRLPTGVVCVFQAARGQVVVSDGSTDQAPGLKNANKDSIRALFQQKAQQAGETFEDLSGVGDYAFVAVGKKTTVVSFVKGTLLVTIMVTLPTAAPSVDTMTTLAKAAADRV